MKQVLLTSILIYPLILCSCSSQGTRNITGCPDMPPKLENTNVELISLTPKATVKSGRVRTDLPTGFRFKARSKQLIDYQTQDDLCIWLYTPSNKLVTGKVLPETGTYVMQVAAPQGSMTFDLKMSLADPKPNYGFFKKDFPKEICGDRKPADPSAFPINFYPVNVPYSRANLSKANSLFCQDAYKKRKEDTGEILIQIASFTNLDKAKAFADFVSSEIPGARVSEPTTVFE